MRSIISSLVGPQEPLLAAVKRRKLAWFGHVTRHNSLSKTILQGALEGGKCWMDNVKEWTSLPMPELLTRASCRKDWKKISAESFLMSRRRSNRSRDWTELIERFSSHRHFKVRVGSTLSELHEQEMGVPQGSILSPALFNIQINNIVKSVIKGTDAFLLVDDFALCVWGKSLCRVERAMQLCVNSVQIWMHENDFKFSNSKTVCIHFCQ